MPYSKLQLSQQVQGYNSCKGHLQVAEFVNTVTHKGYVDNLRYVQVSGHRRQAFPNQVGLICLQSVHLLCVLLRVDGHSADSHLCAGPEDSDGNLTCNTFIRGKNYNTVYKNGQVCIKDTMVSKRCYGTMSACVVFAYL